MIHIRPATPADRDAIITIGCAFTASIEPYRTLFGVVTRDQIGRVVDLMYAFGDKALMLLAVDAAPLDVAATAVVCGCIVVVDVEQLVTGEHYGDELAWWVHPTHRGRWAAPKLLAGAEAWARARHLRTLKMVSPIPSRVGRFYEQRGYVPLETAYLKWIGEVPCPGSPAPPPTATSTPTPAKP